MRWGFVRDSVELGRLSQNYIAVHVAQAMHFVWLYVTLQQSTQDRRVCGTDLLAPLDYGATTSHSLCASTVLPLAVPGFGHTR